jgi:ubiquinone/menaquinone biosynthesis C-methylase UbiE
MDFALGGLGDLRSRALSKVYGEVLEVGSGTGLNFPYYPEAVRKLYALDVDSLLSRRVEERVRQVGFPVERVIVAPHERLPFQDHQFDCVITTWTLCSVSDVPQLLSEIRRVLRSDGIYVFLEHGKAQSSRVASIQTKLNIVSKALANGCRLDLPIDDVIKQCGYKIVDLEKYVNKRTVGVAAYMYQGVATPCP